jgi:aryl-alcohol dehydrogenase-like predicted oxidoreductase
MKYRKIGNTELSLSEITFGAWAAGGWMWGGNDRKEAIAAIQSGYDMGVTSIDTAPAYGQGLSEEIVGEAVKGIPRAQIQILTKYGLRWDLAKGDFHFKSKDNDGKDIDIYKYSGKESIIHECEQSLKRLGTDYIDLYQIHWADSTTPISETMEAVAKLIEQGKVRHAGVCNYTAGQMTEAEKTISLVSNQVPYSMVKRDIEKDVVPYCIEHNKSILAYSPLERGLLTGKLKPGHTFSDGDHRAGLYFFTDENIKRTNDFLKNINGLAESKRATISQIVLRWTLSQSGITIALVGARNAAQAIQNAKASAIDMSDSEIQFISQHLHKLELVKN